MIKNCTAVILTGGESKRMKEDKASVNLAGRTLLEQSIQSLQPLFKPLIISVHEHRKEVDLMQVYDKHEKEESIRCPMLGVIEALKTIKTNWLFVLACDMPFMSQELIYAMAKLRERHQVVVPQVQGALQPVSAFYAQSCLRPMQENLKAGKRSLRTFIEGVDAKIFIEEECRKYDKRDSYNSRIVSFFDIDTPEDILTFKKITKKE